MDRVHVQYRDWMTIGLWRKVRQINGEKIYKRLCDLSEVYSYDKTTIEKELEHKFVFVLNGEVEIIKTKKHYSMNELAPEPILVCTIKCEESWGYHNLESILNWGEKIEVKIKEKSKICVIPIEEYNSLFRRILPVSTFQLRAEFLKKLPIFKDFPMERIIKICCVSQKYCLKEGEFLTQEGNSIKETFIILKGKLKLISTITNENVFINPNEDFLIKETLQDIQVCYFTSQAIEQVEFIMIPSKEFQNFNESRAHSQSQSQSQSQSKSSISKYFSVALEESKTENFFTEPVGESQTKRRGSSLYSKTLYNRPKTSESIEKPRIKSSFKMAYSKNRENYLEKPLKEPQFHSLGEMQLIKFIKRKEKTESKTFFKYIESRAPEIVLNPSKEFAIIKPIYKSPSQYVRNMKRKLKHAMSVSHNFMENDNFLL